MLGRVPAPGHCDFLLRQDHGVFHLVRRLGLQHVDRPIGLGDEIWLILQVVGTLPVDDLELALGGLEPA